MGMKLYFFFFITSLNTIFCADVRFLVVYIQKTLRTMIEYIKGELTELTPALATVEAAGVGYGLNSGSLQEVPIFLNYRHYFDRGRRVKPLINIAAGVALHFWSEEYSVRDPYNTDPWGYPIYNYVEENKHGIGVYGTIAGGFRVRAFSFTGGFFFRTVPNAKGFGGGIEAKVGYTF